MSSTRELTPSFFIARASSVRTVETETPSS
jgi:hypothetical protein